MISWKDHFEAWLIKSDQVIIIMIFLLISQETFFLALMIGSIDRKDCPNNNDDNFIDLIRYQVFW